jgi:hypothetical protein
MAKIGRNQPCPCGSGKKYKRCCLDKVEAARAAKAITPPLRTATFLSNAPRPKTLPANAAQWPIVRAYVPVEDVFRVSGLGTAGIVRRRPDGRCAWAMFRIDLMEHGLGMMFGKDDEPIKKIDQALEEMRDVLPPFEAGTPELAAAYIWGAWALAEAEGSGFPPHLTASYLGLLPRLPGSSESWLNRLVGPGGLSSPDLVEIIRETPPPDEAGEGREFAIMTMMIFRLADAPSATLRLRTSSPDGQGFRFIPGESPENDAIVHFQWARPLPKGPRSMMPVRGDLQIQGWVDIEGDELRAVAMTLSMAARLVSNLKALLGDAIHLEHAHWTSPEEIMAAKRRRSTGARRA